MFHIDNRSRVPIHQQLQAQIVRYVSLGLLLPDQQLPSVRAMAQQLGINPNTVQKGLCRSGDERRALYSSRAGCFYFAGEGSAVPV